MISEKFPQIGVSRKKFKIQIQTFVFDDLKYKWSSSFLGSSAEFVGCFICEIHASPAKRRVLEDKSSV